MQIPLVDLNAQYRSLKPEMDEAIARVLARGDFILGREVAEFEEAFARFIGVKHCIGVASGTDALNLSLRALGVGPGDKVLLPANTFIATALAVSYVGAAPVLVDVDPENFTIDVEQARRALPAGAKAIIPVHLYGQPADMTRLLELAREKGLFVLEDACQAHGARHKLGPCGTLGDLAAFSFYPGKNLGAYGDGGAVCTNDDRLAEKLELLRNWGGTVKYVHREQGFNSRLDTLQAAVLLVKLRRLEEWNRKRRIIADWYREALAVLDTRIAVPSEAAWTVSHVYHLFVIKLQQGRRDVVVNHMRSNGVGVGIHYPLPIHLQGAYRCLGHHSGEFPVTESAADCILSLPLFPEMTAEQVATVVGILAEALDSTARIPLSTKQKSRHVIPA